MSKKWDKEGDKSNSFQDRAYSNYKDRVNHSWKDAWTDTVWPFLKKPMLWVAIILICIILAVMKQYNGLWHEFKTLERSIKWLEGLETRSAKEMGDIKGQIRTVEKKEDELEKKEKNLEKIAEHKEDASAKSESWGEEEGQPHVIHMAPLMPHLGSPFDDNFGMPDFHSIGGILSDHMHHMMPPSLFGSPFDNDGPAAGPQDD